MDINQHELDLCRGEYVDPENQDPSCGFLPIRGSLSALVASKVFFSIRIPKRQLQTALLVVLFSICSTNHCFGARGGELTLRAVDAKTKKPIAVRVHLKNSRGRPAKPRATGAYIHGDHFVIDGQTTLKLRTGRYSFEMEAGPEYKHRTGRFTIEDHADDEKTVEMHRFTDLANDGWLAGDLLIVRSSRQIDRLMRAEGLHVAPLVAEQFVRGKKRPINAWGKEPVQLGPGRWFTASAALDERQGGSLLAFHVSRADDLFPLRVTSERMQDQKTTTPNPSPEDGGGESEVDAATGGGHLDVADPFSWDLPIWLALAEPDSFQLISSHALRHAATDAKKTGRGRDRRRFPGPVGTGIWAETIYYHILNAGLRIAPSAGSGSGNTPNPVGQNRVYVHCGTDATYAGWWKGLRDGKVFVTNGPLLRAAVEGEAPGALFQIGPKEPREFLIGLTLSTREKIDYLQVVKNGQVAIEARLDEWVEAGGRLPPLRFDESGWFLVRAVTDNADVYQFASTGPYYVESDHKRRISRRSAQFFVDWLAETAEPAPPAKASRSEDRKHVLEEARAFWQERLDRANAP